jgi:mannose-6-phosphate isomerase-like protein (cupin superfamily)
MAQYQLAHLDFSAPRLELHELLTLTGTEVSINTLPAGVSVPFVHAHKQNEEVYIILEGKGTLFIDGEERTIAAGDCFRIDPAGQRCISAAADSSLRFICMQVKAGSLENFTMTDGVMSENFAKPTWL